MWTIENQVHLDRIADAVGQEIIPPIEQFLFGCQNRNSRLFLISRNKERYIHSFGPVNKEKLADLITTYYTTFFRGNLIHPTFFNEKSVPLPSLGQFLYTFLDNLWFSRHNGSDYLQCAVRLTLVDFLPWRQLEKENLKSLGVLVR